MVGGGCLNQEQWILDALILEQEFDISDLILGAKLRIQKSHLFIKKQMKPSLQGLLRVTASRPRF